MVQEYRYERKFFVEGVAPQQVTGMLKLHPAMFRQIYPPRHINNIYLDSPLLHHYFANLDGYDERRKSRVRWYHDLFRDVPDGTLEYKVKRGLVGTKFQYPFPAFAFDNRFTAAYLNDTIRQSALPLEIRDDLAGQEPVLINCYRRWYYATPDLKFRVTIDTDLTFYHLNKFDNPFLFKQTQRDVIVVELKYAVEDDPDAGRITAGFPFRMTRSSKYVQGVERIYL